MDQNQTQKSGEKTSVVQLTLISQGLDIVRLLSAVRVYSGAVKICVFRPKPYIFSVQANFSA